MARDLDRARRDVLKALGVGAGFLPILWASRPAHAQPPRRFICTMQTAGYRQMQWRPRVGPLAGTPLPASSAPLEPHKSDVIFLPALGNEHGSGASSYALAFYGLPDRTSGRNQEPNGPTVDQVIARGLPPKERRSLALGVQLDRLPRPSSPVSANRCFWTGAGQPVEPMGDPREAYLSVFANPPGRPTPDAAAIRLLAERKSILDYVGSGIQRFLPRVASDDRGAIEAHLDAIRSIEQQLTSLDPANSPQPNCTREYPPDMVDLSNGAMYPEVLKLHLELIIAAFRCDVTSVGTLQLSDSLGANVEFGRFVPGVPERSPNGFKSPYRNWADLANNPIMNGEDHKAIVDKWFMERLAALISRMKAIREGTGTMLDNVVILWGNHVQDGASKDSTILPWILAGNCGGYFASGQCVAPGKLTTVNVMADVCAAMGVTRTQYGPPVSGIKVE